MDVDPERLDRARGQVLDRMERGNRLVRLAMAGGASVEALLIAGALLLLDWSNRAETLMFVMFVLSYTIIVFGLIALAGHVTRCTARILAILDPGAP
jgi:hypothetical protein